MAPIIKGIDVSSSSAQTGCPIGQNEPPLSKCRLESRSMAIFEGGGWEGVLMSGATYSYILGSN
jgi:hypothetical protein